MSPPGQFPGGPHTGQGSWPPGTQLYFQLASRYITIQPRGLHVQHFILGASRYKTLVRGLQARLYIAQGLPGIKFYRQGGFRYKTTVMEPPGKKLYSKGPPGTTFKVRGPPGTKLIAGGPPGTKLYSQEASK